VEDTLGDGGPQGLVVAFCLFGVVAGEAAHGPVDLVAAAEVTGRSQVCRVSRVGIFAPSTAAARWSDAATQAA
jgi:hypothetical protein